MSHKNDFAVLTAWMTGSFSTAAQAASDDRFFAIQLEMAHIWPTRTDGYWLYVEQALATKLEEPYRQRVYRVTAQDNGRFASEIYMLPEPQRWIGAWRSAEPWAMLDPEQLEPKAGCTVFLTRQADGSFVGGTEGSGCQSELRGASYATSEVHLNAEQLVSLDRGYDATGTQVWGSTVGGYIFTRVKSDTLRKG